MADPFFLYGTLIAGSDNPVARAVHADLEPMGPASVSGALYALPDPLGWFPALRPGFGTVRGVLYRPARSFDERTLARMDFYEDCDPLDPGGSLYRRAFVAARIAGEGVVRASAYLYNRALPPGAVRLPAGDFPAWLSAQGHAAYGAGGCALARAADFA